ncbi:MAG: GHKL domain-containing protein, partial [Anaerovoracaceae bacterium]
NPVAEEMVFDGKTVKTTKLDKNAHGFGMENMLQTAEKNRGTIQWCDDEKGFVTTKIELEIL